MKVSCSSLFLWEYSIYELVEILVSAGIGSIEFWIETPDFWRRRHDETAQAELKEAISLLPDGCTLHAPILDLNPSSYNDYVHEITINETLWSLKLAKRIEARVVTVHPGRRTVRRAPTDEDWEKFRRYLKLCKNRADALGVELSLENSSLGISSMCSSVEEMKEVLCEFPGLFFTLDIVHAGENAIDFIKELYDKIINVHIGAVYEGIPHYPSHHDNTADRVLLALKELGYIGDLTIEIDDKAYSKPMSREEKLRELIEEREYLYRF